MSLEQAFSAASVTAMLGWILLAILPRHPVAHRIAGLVIPLALSISYLYLIATHLSTAQGGFGSLADVALLFQKQELLLAGWIHYLAFDLFIGAWISRDAYRTEIPHLVVLPCLVMTFMLGPIGLLFYFAIRSAKSRTLSLDKA